MINFREVNDYDVLKEWINFREEDLLSYTSEQDKAHNICFEEISANIIRNVPNKNKKYVEKQLELLDKNYMDHLCYWNEKYYRNGFVDGSQLVIGCFEE